MRKVLTDQQIREKAKKKRLNMFVTRIQNGYGTLIPEKSAVKISQEVQVSEWQSFEDQLGPREPEYAEYIYLLNPDEYMYVAKKSMLKLLQR